MKRYVFENGKLHLENLQLPELKKAFVSIQNTAVGVNFLDRESLKHEDFASGKRHLGFEGVGVIKAFHQSCARKWAEGQRVCYATCYGVGSFADEVQIHEDFLIPVPDDISNEQAATIFKGLTAHMLLFRSYMLRKNDTIGLTSPTSGVGTYVSQWASNVGIKVVGLIMNEAHKSTAIQNGCESVFSYKETENFISHVKKISTGGLGCNVFYDSLGAKAYPVGIKSLAPFGTYMNFGDLTGEIEKISPKHLQKKALFFTTPSVFYSKANNAELVLTGAMIFAGIREGSLRPSIKTYKMKDLGHALQDVGKVAGNKVVVF